MQTSLPHQVVRASVILIFIRISIATEMHNGLSCLSQRKLNVGAPIQPQNAKLPVVFIDGYILYSVYQAAKIERANLPTKSYASGERSARHFSSVMMRCLPLMQCILGIDVCVFVVESRLLYDRVLARILVWLRVWSRWYVCE